MNVWLMFHMYNLRCTLCYDERTNQMCVYLYIYMNVCMCVCIYFIPILCIATHIYIYIYIHTKHYETPFADPRPNWAR